MSDMALPFTPAVMSSFIPCKELRCHAEESLITSMDFDDTGRWCVTASTDETIQLYDCRLGKPSKSVPSKKYGAHLARFLHHSTDVAFASTKGDDTIRYLSIYENKFVRYFKGHRNKVTCLEVSPINDTMLTTALDRTLRLWDLRQPDARGLLAVKGHSLAAFDATGLVFAVAVQDLKSVALYDTRNFESAPFLVFSCELEGSWQKVELSNNGKFILIASNTGNHVVHDALSGVLLGSSSGCTPMQRKVPSTSPAAFSLDGNYLFAGSDDDVVAMYDLNGLQNTDEASPAPKLTPTKLLPAYKQPGIIGFSSKLMLMATADTTLTLWLTENH